MAGEEQEQENFHQRVLRRIQRMKLTIIQVDIQSNGMACPSLRKGFRPRIHNMSKKVLGVETTPCVASYR
jgi:hypothetical protein